jgi:hypothetical protein
LLPRFVIAHALSHALSHPLFCSFSSPLRLQRHSMIKEPRSILLCPPPSTLVGLYRTTEGLYGT